jgi:hypothetical protein
VIVGGRARAGRAGRGAGAGEPKWPGPRRLRLERLQRAAHGGGADGRADARLRAEGRDRRHRGQARSRAVARRRRGRLRAFEGAFKVYIGHHGDKGAHAADIMCCPAPPMPRKPGPTSTPRAACSSPTRRCSPPATRARTGRSCARWPMRSGRRRLRQLRRAARGDGRRGPALGRRGAGRLRLKLRRAKAGSKPKASGPVAYPIKDFYLTNPIARASPTMQRCSAELLHGEETLEAAE